MTTGYKPHRPFNPSEASPSPVFQPPSQPALSLERCHYPNHGSELLAQGTPTRTGLPSPQAQLPQLYSRGGHNDLMCCPALTFWAPVLQEERKRAERKGETGGGGRRGLEQSREADMIGENLVGFWGVEFFCFSSLHAEVMNLNTG